MISPNFIDFAAKTLEMYNDIMKYATLSFGLIMTCAPQNMQFSQYFTTKFNIFSLNLTGESDFFILVISTHNELESGF